MNRFANVVLVLGALSGVAAIVMGVVVVVNYRSPGPDTGIGLSLMTLALTLVVLGTVLKRGHRRAVDTAPRQDR